MSSGLVVSSSSLASLSEDDQRRLRERTRDREARSLALEKAYVHDVYEQISGEFVCQMFCIRQGVKLFL